MGVVGMDPAGVRRGKHNRLGPVFVEPAIDRHLMAQVHDVAADRQQTAFLFGQPAGKRRADHPAMTGHEYASSGQRKQGSRRHALNRFPRWRCRGPGR